MFSGAANSTTLLLSRQNHLDTLPRRPQKISFMGFMVSSRPQMVSLQFRRGQVVQPKTTTTTRLPEYIHPGRDSEQRVSWPLQYPRPMQTYHPREESNVEAHWTSTREDKDKVYAPYPKWVTLLARGVLAMFELAAVVYLVHFAREWRGERKVRGLDAGIGDVSCAGCL
jgi:hypothetical protein